MKKVYNLLLGFLTFLMTLTVGVKTPAVNGFAQETATVSPYDSSSVLDDLDGATIEGKEFVLTDYAANPTGNVELITFTEYGYDTEAYGLYAYVYNPQKLNVNTTSVLNTVELKVNEEEHYSKYPLTFISSANEGVLLKCKVSLSIYEKNTLLSLLNSEKRTYSVSSVELIEYGDVNATDYSVGKRYEYTTSLNDIVSCTVIPFETLSLDVHPAVYRPAGTNGTENTQDCLHSVYFAVPNEYIEKYGEMTAIQATWLNAVLRPGLVTGNQEAYETISSYVGQPFYEYNEFVPTYISDYKKTSHGQGVYSYSADWVFNSPRDMGNGVLGHNLALNPLYLLFNSGDTSNSADTYTVSSEDLKERLSELSTLFGGSSSSAYLNGKYAKVLFSSYDDDFTTVYKKASDMVSLTSEVIGSSFWDKLFGRTETTVFDGIPVLEKLEANDFLTMFPKQCADGLYVSLEDWFDMQLFANEKMSDHTCYIFRYQVSDYVAKEATLYDVSYNSLIGGYQLSAEDTNAYFFQETVNLDFDMIDVEFEKDGILTQIPVVSNPIDVIPDITPPVNITTDDDGTPWWFWAIIAVVALILLCLIKPVFEVVVWILKAVWWLITSPVRLIILIVKKVRGDYD